LAYPQLRKKVMGKSTDGWLISTFKVKAVTLAFLD
jgi:hypothetical protein